jgi:hypothetical protein
MEGGFTRCSWMDSSVSLNARARYVGLVIEHFGVKSYFFLSTILIRFKVMFQQPQRWLWRKTLRLWFTDLT